MLADIQQAIPRLSRAERRVADWVLAHPRQVTGRTVAAVARAAGVSEPTVVRFCRSVGSDGFRDFKLRLAASVGPETSYLHSDVGHADSIETAVQKVVDRSIRDLHEIRGACRAMPFAAAADALAAARQVVFVGLGASGIVATDACHKFFRLGVPCTTATDAPTVLQYGAIAEREDAFVAISRSGLWPGVIDGMTRAAGRGATVIALTTDPSPLASTATLLFGLRVTEDSSLYTPMSGRLAQLAVLDALQVSLALAIGAPAEARLAASKRVLTS